MDEVTFEHNGSVVHMRKQFTHPRQ
jgi:hypothetical protein